MLPESSSVSYDLLIDQQFLLILNSRDLSLEYINFPALAYCGRPLKDLKKTFLEEVVHPEDLESFRASLSPANDFKDEVQVRFKAADNSWNSFLFRSRPYFNGETERILSLGKKSEGEQKKNESIPMENFQKNEYEHLLESLDEAFALVEVIYSPEGEAIDYLFLKTNPSYEQQANLKDVVGKTVSEVLPGYSRTVLKTVGQVAITGKSVRFQERSTGLNNVWFDLYAFKVGGNSSRQVALLFRNITEGKVAEEKMKEELSRNQESLKESKELLQSVFDTTNLGIAVLRTIYSEDGSVKDFQFARVNKVVREMYLQEDVIGHSYLETTKYGVEMGIFDAYKKVMATGEPFDEEFYFSKEGYDNWFRITARKNRDLLITTLEDITRVKKEGEALKESLRFTKELVETTPEVILIVNLNTFRVKYINKDIVPEAGITKEKVQNLGLPEIVPFIHPRDREKMMELHRKLLKSPNDKIYDIELRLKLSGVTWEWFNVRGKIFLRRDENWVDEYVLLVRNISEQKHTQKALLKAEKLSIQGELARTFAHELRNPLASIGMVGEVLSQKIPEEKSEELKPYFEILKRSTKTLNNLVSHLLNASNYTPSILEKQDLAEILNSTIENASDRIYLAGIKVEKNFKGSFPVMADKEKLQIALLNLIVNASEATTPGEGIIEIGIEPHETEFVVSIRDNGHGMEDHEIEHLFEAFYSKKENGMGVGLSSVKNILEEHDAQIKVKSEPGKGTCFKLYFHNAAHL